MTDFLSLAWKTEAWGFEVEGLFLLRPPVFMAPGAVCGAKVGLEMVKHNGDSVRPEGPKPRSSVTVGNRREVLGLLRAPQSVSSQASAVRGNRCEECSP